MFFKIFSFIFYARTIKPVLTFEYFGFVFSKLKPGGSNELASSAGDRFSKVPVTFRAREAILCARCLH